MPKLYNVRREYRTREFSEASLQENPFRQFQVWFNEALNSGIEDPNAMVLSTVGANGRPSSRIVLLKDFNDTGFTLFTNYESRKGRELEKNPFAALLFLWYTIDRQVRIEGKVERVTEKDSDRYFRERPPGSRIGAWASPQSSEIPSREYLDELERKFREKFNGEPIPRPRNWGGYRLIPDRFEFWQGRENRLHDRFEYYLVKKDWKIRRLAP